MGRILPFGCSIEDLIATTVDGNYTYVRYSNDGDAGTGFSSTYNSSNHNYVGIITSTSEISNPSVSDFVGKWVEKQEQYTYYAFATSDSGANFSITYTGVEHYVAIINSSTEISSLQASDFTGKRFPITSSTTEVDYTEIVHGSNLISNSINDDRYPIEQFLIKNEEFDNTLDSTECNPITVTSINTTSKEIVLSWVPNINSIFNPEPDKEWILVNLDDHSTAPGGFFSGGYYTSVFKITGGTYATKTLTYTWIGSGSEATTSGSDKVSFWNPDMDGFTRHSGNPVLTGSDFLAVEPAIKDIATHGIMKKSDGTYVLFMECNGSTGVNANRHSLYATSPDLLNWTPVATALFTSGRPSWCNIAAVVMDTPIYLPDEDKYIACLRGNDSALDGDFKIGWVKFNEDFDDYSFSPNPIIDTANLDKLNLIDGWRTANAATDIDRVYYASLLEKDGVWYLYYNVLGGFYGTHNGGDGESSLTDTARTNPFVAGEFASWSSSIVYNLTDGSSGSCSTNTATGVTATLSGGTDNDWDDGDEYLIVGYTARMHLYAVSDSPYGPFKHHKAVNKNPISNDGAMGNSHMETCQLFNYKRNPHVMIGETSATDFSGVKGRRIFSLAKLDTSTGQFIKDRKSPVFASWQYADIARITTAYDWEIYHVGGTLIPYIDEDTDRIYYIYTAKDASINYEVGVAYRDLSYYK